MKSLSTAHLGLLTGTNHGQMLTPKYICRLRDPGVPVRINLSCYDAPEQRHVWRGCVRNLEGTRWAPPRSTPRIRIHCKTQDIKESSLDIETEWVVPQGGEGPNYSELSSSAAVQQAGRQIPI